MKSETSSKIYKRKGSPYYYYDIKDPVTGKRVRRSTKQTSYHDALIIYKSAVCDSLCSYATPVSPLAQLIAAYTDTDTNPRYKQAQIDGTSYGLQHAQRVANHAKYLASLLEREAPNIYRKKIMDVTKLDIKQIKAILVEKKGRCRMSQNIFQDLKTWFSQASEDGIVEINVAKDIRNIQYEEKKRCAIEPELIASLIQAKEHFVNIEDWAYFTILATTGMRRSEALALNIEQLNGNILNIDRALKSGSQNDIGLPKCNVTRVIPLANITIEAINAIEPDSKGRLFPHGRYFVDGVFHRIQALACSLYPDYTETWQSMTPHILRHSLNTNLLCVGESAMLVAEYLSWAHQDLIDMQTRYTHIYASSMQSIADRIDEMYGDKKRACKIALTSSIDR